MCTRLWSSGSFSSDDISAFGSLFKVVLLPQWWNTWIICHYLLIIWQCVLMASNLDFSKRFTFSSVSICNLFSWLIPPQIHLNTFLFNFTTWLLNLEIIFIGKARKFWLQRLHWNFVKPLSLIKIVQSSLSTTVSRYKQSQYITIFAK